MKKGSLFFLCLTLFCLAGVINAESVSVKSPDGKNEIKLIAEKTLQYAVFCNGKVRVAPTDINVTIEGGRMLGVKPEIADILPEKSGLKIKLAPGGGWTARLQPAKRFFLW